MIMTTKKIMFVFDSLFVFILFYGGWEALDIFKILPQGPPAFSEPGEAIPILFEETIPPPRGRRRRRRRRRRKHPPQPNPLSSRPGMEYPVRLKPHFDDFLLKI